MVKQAVELTPPAPRPLDPAPLVAVVKQAVELSPAGPRPLDPAPLAGVVKQAVELTRPAPLPFPGSARGTRILRWQLGIVVA